MTADGSGSEADQPGFAERLLGRVVGPVVDSVDVDQVVQQIDVDDVVDRIDVDHLVQRIDVNALLDRVDPDALLDRVDPDRLLDRVDVNGLLDRVDPDRLLDRVDVNALVDRVDPDRLLDRVDVNALVDRTELRSIIARSTTGVFAEVLDVVRTRVMAVDQAVQGIAGTVVGRRRRTLPAAPDGSADADRISGDLTYADRAVALQRRYAGSISRFLAFLLDQFVIGVLFAVGAFLVAAAAEVVFGANLAVDEDRPVIIVSYSLWWFVYMAVGLAASGKTLGKTVLGVRVMRADGTPLDGRHAILRTVVFPLSFLVFGIGFVIGLFRADRRELHDLIASTAVIYDWDAATTQLRARDGATPT